VLGAPADYLPLVLGSGGKHVKRQPISPLPVGNGKIKSPAVHRGMTMATGKPMDAMQMHRVRRRLGL